MIPREDAMKAPRSFVASILMAAVFEWPSESEAQELEARAFSPSPIGVSFLIAGAGRSEGAFVLDPASSVSDVEADISFVTLGGGYTFDLFGRQTRILAVFPYAWGDISGESGGVRQTLPLDGLTDPRIKLSVGLIGAPALSPEEFARTKRTTSVGASLTVTPPLGRYDPNSLVNLGYNRWGLKPEIGISHPVGNWTLEASGGVWLFSDNDEYFPGNARRSQDPIETVQVHVGYTIEDKSWLALDVAWFSGGETEIDGLANPDHQDNARLGLTYSMPVSKQQSLKLTYSTGSSTRRGADYDTVNITWQAIRY
jgi:hypothetical protein